MAVNGVALPVRAPELLRLGTRRSALALAQSQAVARALEARHPGLRIELVPRTTAGDRLPGDLAAAGGKGLFTRELEQGLSDGSLDLAVHSLKDLPVSLPAGLAVAAHPERADPRDVLVSELAADLDGLPAGAVVLTGSLRRRAQILLYRPDLRVEPIRGNVDTRLRKWQAGGGAALVLAGAGLARLGWLAQDAADAGGAAGTASAGGARSQQRLPIHPIAPAVLLPAPGQGTLALEVRAGAPAAALCAALDHQPTAAAARAERLVVAAFGGDCALPLAAWARWEEKGLREEGLRLRLTALLATPDGRQVARGEAAGADAGEVAAACIAALRRDGADEVLARVRRQC